MVVNINNRSLKYMWPRQVERGGTRLIVTMNLNLILATLKVNKQEAVSAKKSSAQGEDRTHDLEIMRLARHRLRHLGLPIILGGFY